MKNALYCFSGTGNSLYVAQRTGEVLGNSEITPMTSKQYTPGPCDSIGFIFPVYFQGLPQIVHDFIQNIDLSNSRNTYLYAIETHGGMPGNGLAQANRLLQQKGAHLSYGANLRMVANYVAMYDMSKKTEKTEKKADDSLAHIVQQISSKNQSAIKKPVALFEWWYSLRIKPLHSLDRHHNVSSACTGCRTCEKICPVRNIEFSTGRPSFLHHCEQCMACIQFCPERALNYKNLTQKRGRYQNPNIGLGKMLSFYGTDVER